MTFASPAAAHDVVEEEDDEPQQMSPRKESTASRVRFQEPERRSLERVRNQERAKLFESGVTLK